MWEIRQLSDCLAIQDCIAQRAQHATFGAHCCSLDARAPVVLHHNQAQSAISGRSSSVLAICKLCDQAASGLLTKS